MTQRGPAGPGGVEPGPCSVRFGARTDPAPQGRHDSPRRFPCRSFASARLSLALGAALLLAATGAQAQFKVIGADGKVTYTDREPSRPKARSPRSARKAPRPGRRARPAVRAAPGRPRSTRSRSTPRAARASPASQARQYLKQRGIPFSERQVVSDEDIEALEKLSGGREAPTLTHRLAGPARLRSDSGASTSTPPAIRASRACRRATSTVPRRRSSSAAMPPSRAPATPRRRRRQRCRARPRRRRRHRPAGSASSRRRRAGGVVRETPASPRRCGAPRGCRSPPPPPSARTAPRRRASRRRGRTRAA